jgi:hypothetical protein
MVSMDKSPQVADIADRVDDVGLLEPVNDA